MNSRTSGFLSILVAMMFAFSAPAARSETVAATDVVAPLVVAPLASPNPVLGSDGLTHLAYEFTLMSMASSGVTIQKVETLDAATGKVIGTLDGDALAKMLRLNGGIKGVELGAGGSGILFMDVTISKDEPVPAKAFTSLHAERGQGAASRSLEATTIQHQRPRRKWFSPPIRCPSGLRPSWWRRHSKARAGRSAVGAARRRAIIAAPRSRSTDRSMWPNASPSISCS